MMPLHYEELLDHERTHGRNGTAPPPHEEPAAETHTDTVAGQQDAAPGGRDADRTAAPDPIREQIEAFEAALGDRFAAEAAELRYLYEARYLPAKGELEQLEQQARAILKRESDPVEKERTGLAETIGRLAEEIRAIDEQLMQERDGFVGLVVKAGLTVDARSIGPFEVEDALHEAKPNDEEAAGGEGIEAPGPAERSGFAHVLHGLFEAVAPLASGYVVALTAGSLIGILSLADVRHRESGMLLTLATLLGCVAVFFIGAVLESAVRSVGRCTEPASEDCPRFRSAAVMAGVLVVAACLLVAAELTVEALGLRDLHLQRLIELRRIDGVTELHTLPLIVYYLLGVLVSGPYIAYKAGKSWTDREERLRGGFLAALQRQWVETRRREEPVQNTFASSYHVDLLEAQREVKLEEKATLEERRDGLRAPQQVDRALGSRIEAARKAASAAGEELHAKIRTLFRQARRLEVVAGRKQESRVGPG